MEYEYDVALQPLRNSYASTMDTTISSGAAVLVTIPGRAVPTKVHNSGTLVRNDSIVSSGVAVPVAIPAQAVSIQVKNGRRASGEASQISQLSPRGGKGDGDDGQLEQV